MRLLQKNEIEAKKTSERRFQLDEGLKTVKKIETVREILALEESNLRKFRETTTKIVQQEIDALIAKKGRLEQEVKELENKLT